MVYRALLLTPDDELIREYALPKVEPVIYMAKMSKPSMTFYSEKVSPMDIEVSFTRIRFLLQPRESRIYSLLVPDTLVYRQEGWERDHILIEA